MAIRPRFLATTLLVLMALGGAGLAVAADRGQDGSNQPQATQSPDQVAQVWIATLGSDLSALAKPAGDLATAGRDTLGNLQGLNFDAMRTAMQSGDAAVARINAGLDGLSLDIALANSNVDRSQVGPDTAAQLDAIDKAVSSATRAARSWDLMKARATLVAGLVGDLQQHDQLVFQATTAGRQSSWSNALDAIDSGGNALDDARAAGATLRAAGATTDTLDELITRYANYDAALRALYSYVETNGQEAGDAVRRAHQGGRRCAEGAAPGWPGLLGHPGRGRRDALRRRAR